MTEITIQIDGSDIWYQGYRVAVFSPSPPATIRSEFYSLIENLVDNEDLQETLAAKNVEINEANDERAEFEKDLETTTKERDALNDVLQEFKARLEDLDLD